MKRLIARFLEGIRAVIMQQKVGRMQPVVVHELPMKSLKVLIDIVTIIKVKISIMENLRIYFKSEMWAPP